MRRYSVFLSSTYQDMREERRAALAAIMDHNMTPICMEHFTASNSENFRYIQELIDICDVFIMLLGDQYGSCDENGISWTEREYNYASQPEKGIKIFVFRTNKFTELVARATSGEELTDNERKLYEFGIKREFAQEITDEATIGQVVSRALSGIKFGVDAGWVRISEQIRKAKEEHERWTRENKEYDLGGKWYHVHLMPNDSTYIRVGTVEITQQFDEANFRMIHMDANNYDISRVDFENRSIRLNKLHRTMWHGEYFINRDNIITGVYRTQRLFDDAADPAKGHKGQHWGVHTFVPDSADEEEEDSFCETTQLSGTFNDISHIEKSKSGQIFLFRSADERFNFLEDNYSEVLKEFQK